MKILFISHRIPYPPDKGDKIRAFNELKYLSKDYDVHLFTHIDCADDETYVDDLRSYGVHVSVVRINPLVKKLRVLPYLMTDQSLSVSYFYEAEMQNKINAVLADNAFDLIFCYSSTMAEYLFRTKTELIRNTPLLMDFVDLDSDKWFQYSENSKWPFSWIYRHEGVTLQAYEKKIGQTFDASIFVTEKERNDFLRLVNIDDVYVISNGVDTDMFSPTGQYPAVLENGCHLVFTGAMDYHANIDGVCWFVNNVLPIINKELGNIKFVIVGRNPAAAVKKLESENVIVTGEVPDTRPYIMQSDVIVVPLRLARGIQNKVLEGMAMAKPVVVTSQARQGISLNDENELLVADTPEDFAEKVISILLNRELCRKLGTLARSTILEKYSWEGALSKFEPIIESVRRC